MAPPTPLTARQPFKALYIGWFVISGSTRLVLHTLYYIPRANRPFRRWSLGVSSFLSTFRLVFSLLARIRARPAYSHTCPKGQEARFSLAPAAPAATLALAAATQPAHAAGIAPSAVPVLWLPERPAPADLSADARILLHFHGGAFLIFSPFDATMHTGPTALVAAMAGPPGGGSARKVYAALPQYRLASAPGAAGAFPAPLLDAAAAYAWLVAQGVEASRIVLSGDSAGATLALMLARWLAEAGLPPPLALLLHSPWLDMLRYADGKDHDPLWKDCLPPELLALGIRSVTEPPAAPEPWDPAGPYFSPMRHPFDPRCPVWCQIGTNELFLQDVRTFVEAYRKAGVDVESFEIEGGMHNTFLGREGMGCRDEADAACREAAAFVDRHAAAAARGST